VSNRLAHGSGACPNTAHPPHAHPPHACHSRYTQPRPGACQLVATARWVWSGGGVEPVEALAHGSWWCAPAPALAPHAQPAPSLALDTMVSLRYPVMLHSHQNPPPSDISSTHNPARPLGRTSSPWHEHAISLQPHTPYAPRPSYSADVLWRVPAPIDRQG